ncbi:hypothetical protein HMPREF9088_2133 [Enterococcus italicus DSM 15952]|uniref:Uncharacterized protein n=1 Tax=Enterococcus italicus (strain DSM 15952 / CCUG 50447 / LMG 22039 / TP 1.5) TaxID=888064 RepID=E6LIE3_ENTI1|nr:hypothetical protein HMPREF9088_2133 [Enterococcus italicus DSM 15952]
MTTLAADTVSAGSKKQELPKFTRKLWEFLLFVCGSFLKK